MTHPIGDAIASAMAGWMLALVLGSGVFWAVVFFGIPWLWRLIKPWLHAVTG